jgi:hypothetical protein
LAKQVASNMKIKRLFDKWFMNGKFMDDLFSKERLSLVAEIAVIEKEKYNVKELTNLKLKGYSG